MARFFRTSVKKLSDACKLYTMKLEMLFDDNLGDLADYDSDLRFLFSLDGTHCPIEEPRPFSEKWSSKKLGGSAGVGYEILLCIDKPVIAWVRGPMPPGSHNDVKTFKGKLKGEMETKLPDKRIIADLGYRGEEVDHIISNVNEFDSRPVAEWKDRVLARHETINPPSYLRYSRKSFDTALAITARCFVLCFVSFSSKLGMAYTLSLTRTCSQIIDRTYGNVCLVLC